MNLRKFKELLGWPTRVPLKGLARERYFLERAIERTNETLYNMPLPEKGTYACCIQCYIDHCMPRYAMLQDKQMRRLERLEWLKRRLGENRKA